MATLVEMPELQSTDRRKSQDQGTTKGVMLRQTTMDRWSRSLRI